MLLLLCLLLPQEEIQRHFACLNVNVSRINKLMRFTPAHVDGWLLLLVVLLAACIHERMV
jgi:hypothetical protein